MVNRAGLKGGSSSRQAPRDGGGRKKSGFVYQPRSEKSIKERGERQGGAFDSIFKNGFDIFKAKQGDNLIRILPATWENADHYGYQVWVHSYVGADNSSYLCPSKMLNKYCPICKAAKEAKDEGDQEEAKALSPAEKYVYWVLDRDDDPIPMLQLVSWTQDRDIAALCRNPRSGKTLMIDLEDNGYDVIVKRTGQKLNTRYLFQIDREPTPIADNVKDQEEVLDYIVQNPIPSVLNFYSAEHLEKVINGSVEAKDEEVTDDDQNERDREAESENEGREARSSQSRRQARGGRDSDRRTGGRRGRSEPEEQEQEGEEYDPETGEVYDEGTEGDEGGDDYGDAEGGENEDGEFIEEDLENQGDEGEGEEEEQQEEKQPASRVRPRGQQRTEQRRPAREERRPQREQRTAGRQPAGRSGRASGRQYRD